MTTDPQPRNYQGLLDASSTARFKLKGTRGLFVQEIVISVDTSNGSINITEQNFAVQGRMEEIGTANIIQDSFITVDNVKSYFFGGGIKLKEDILFTFVETADTNTLFQITVIPARKGTSPFDERKQGVGLNVLGTTPVAPPPFGPG